MSGWWVDGWIGMQRDETSDKATVPKFPKLSCGKETPIVKNKELLHYLSMWHLQSHLTS